MNPWHKDFQEATRFEKLPRELEYRKTAFMILFIMGAKSLVNNKFHTFAGLRRLANRCMMDGEKKGDNKTC